MTTPGPLGKPVQAVDRRLRFSGWLKEFERRGGQLVTKTVTDDDLEPLAESHDLVVIATGKGDITYQLFERDAERSLYDEPPRNLAMVTVTNTKPWSDVAFHPIRFTFIAAVCELFWVPLFDKSQLPSYSVAFDAKCGGPMDRFVGQVKSGQEVVETAKNVIRDLVPWDYEKVKDATLNDELAWLTGEFPPTEGKPVGRRSSGKMVMALGDRVITYDPITAHGANSA